MEEIQVKDEGTETLPTERESPPSGLQNGGNDNNCSHGTGKSLSAFPCWICGKVFGKKGHMIRHLLTHEPEKPFGCDFCSKRFAAKYSLQMHLLNAHSTDAKPFECDLCEKRFTLKKELDQHTKFHNDGFKSKSFQCLHCDLKFISENDLCSHMEISHSELETEFNCGTCRKSFPRKYSLVRHEQTHDRSDFVCVICNNKFGSKLGFKVHLEAHELEVREKPLTCHICGKKFALEQNLDTHVLYHNQAEEKPFSCEPCKVRFKTQERLDKHYDTHGPGREGRVFPCQYCEKTFPRKYNYIRHEMSHTHGRRKPKEGMPIPIHRIQEQKERKEVLHAVNNVSATGTTSFRNVEEAEVWHSRTSDTTSSTSTLGDSDIVIEEDLTVVKVEDDSDEDQERETELSQCFNTSWQTKTRTVPQEIEPLSTSLNDLDEGMMSEQGDNEMKPSFREPYSNTPPLNTTCTNIRNKHSVEIVMGGAIPRNSLSKFLKVYPNLMKPPNLSILSTTELESFSISNSTTEKVVT